MTFCSALKVKEGLIGIADTRITSGTERITAKKITIQQKPREKHAFFIMTSGLRSVRDKALTYFDEVIDEQDVAFDKLYKAVNAFAEQVRRVASEDSASLTQSGLIFDLYALVAGQLQEDKEPKVYMLYPQGNWVEMSQSSPFFIIGNSGYGKPILERVLHYDVPLRVALKAGFLSFEATRISATDVGYPIDVVIQRADEHRIIEHRFEHEDLHKYSKWWQEKICTGLKELPEDWVDTVFDKFQQ
ncbi:MAG: peptidase [Candidatus Omnitrophica bacterium]|nr:peptidase [Candidatus Omnitrophota bacterium]MCB9720320.1 peptidase [Candidatus Omnitrophota bacterium]